GGLDSGRTVPVTGRSQPLVLSRMSTDHTMVALGGTLEVVLPWAPHALSGGMTARIRLPTFLPTSASTMPGSVFVVSSSWGSAVRVEPRNGPSPSRIEYVTMAWLPAVTSGPWPWIKGCATRAAGAGLPAAAVIPVTLPEAGSAMIRGRLGSVCGTAAPLAVL